MQDFVHKKKYFIDEKIEYGEIVYSVDCKYINKQTLMCDYYKGYCLEKSRKIDHSVNLLGFLQSKVVIIRVKSCIFKGFSPFILVHPFQFISV